jgi:uncharacterized membrane protein YwzB
MVGIYATLAWTFFFSTVMESGILAFTGGLFAGFFIMLFDRALISSISYGKKNFWALSFRFTLALILGVFLSQPIILKLYEPDIKREAAILIDRKNQERKKEIEQLYAKEVENLNKREQEINQVLSDKKKQLQVNEDAFKNEMDGTGGTGRVGYSTISKKKESIYMKDVADLQELSNKSQPELKQIDARLDSIQADVNRQLNTFVRTTGNQGFLIQAEALQSLLKNDKTHTLRNRYYLLMVILTLIELSALISKLILDTGSYSKKVEYILDREMKETAADKELFTNKIENYKKLTMERETGVMHDFFEKSNPVRQKKMDNLVNGWFANTNQTYSHTWNMVQHDLMLHDVSRGDGELRRRDDETKEEEVNGS